MSFSRVWVGSVEKVVAGVVGWVVTRKREPLMMELLGGAVVDQSWEPRGHDGRGDDARLLEDEGELII